MKINACDFIISYLLLRSFLSHTKQQQHHQASAQHHQQHHHHWGWGWSWDWKWLRNWDWHGVGVGGWVGLELGLKEIGIDTELKVTKLRFTQKMGMDNVWRSGSSWSSGSCRRKRTSHTGQGGGVPCAPPPPSNPPAFNAFFATCKRRKYGAMAKEKFDRLIKPPSNLFITRSLFKLKWFFYVIAQKSPEME